MKALVGVYGVYDLVEMWQRYQLQSPRENNIENFMGVAPMEDPQRYFEASSINYATFANNQIGVFLAVGTEDDLVDRRVQTDAFLRRLKQAGFCAHLHPAGRAALLGRRSDRRARQLFRLHGPAPHPLPEGAAVTGQSHNTSCACLLLNISLDYKPKLTYESHIPLTRGVSGDDPDGGAGCGVDRGS